MDPRGIGTPLVILTTLVLLTVPAPSVIAGASAGRVGSSSVTALNWTWAGYLADTGRIHSVTKVTGSWIVPRISSSCKAPPGNRTTEFYAGIGMDGSFPSPSVFEFIGIWGDCVAGSGARHYGVAVEYSSVSLSPRLKISPGNVISAEISYVGGRLEFSLTNHNTSATYWHNATKAASNAARATAEWLSIYGVTLSLAPYRTIEFGPAYTHLNGTDTMTAFGSTRAIGNHTSVYRLSEKSQMTRGAIAATPTPLFGNGSFRSLWKGY